MDRRLAPAGVRSNIGRENEVASEAFTAAIIASNGGGGPRNGGVPQRRLRSSIKFHANTDKVNIVKDSAIYRADRELHLAHFKELMQTFRKTSNKETGTISLEDFKIAFSSVLGQGLTDEQMSILFMKIDANTDNAIDWDDFSTYMLLRAEGQKLMREEAETQLFDSEPPKYQNPSPHKDVIVRIQFIDALKKYMSCSRDGTICYWNENLKIQRSFRNAGQVRSEFAEPQKQTQSHKTGPGTQHSRWIHDAVLMDNVNKLAVASDDHQITIYDGTTLQKALCLDLQNVNVLTLDYWTDIKNPDSSESMLLYGTDSGCVNVFTFNNDRMFKVGVRQKDQVEQILVEKDGVGSKALKSWGTMWKRRAHGDWTVKVKYIPDLHAIISCSPDPRESLVVAVMDLNHKWQIHVSPVHKGVNAFAYSRFPVALITGGTDRQLRLWNPHRLHHPMAAMRGHSSPIIEITVNELNGQVISLSIDKDIKIWDIRKQQCLQTIADSVIHRPDDTISAMLFNPHGRRLVAGTYSIVSYSLREQTAVDETKSHDFPIRAVMYNSAFKQIVSGCDGSIVNVWDATSGQKTFRFSEAHGKSEITAMAFDAGGRRLATGGRDGTIRVWNFNNGQLLQELVKKDNTEVTGLTYIDLRDTAYFVATGWNRKVTIFSDDPDSLTLYPIFTWPDPQTVGSPLSWHEDDILSMAFCPPNILATSSYDGEIVICNLHSGHVLHRLRPVEKNENVNTLKSQSIDKVLFLEERCGMREAANLLSTGSDGRVRFWNIANGTLMAEVDCTQKRTEGIFTMIANSNNSLLFTGDALGWVCEFDIRDIALGDGAPMVMPLVVSFRAHVNAITGMDLIESHDVIVTCSVDATIRMFTMRGDFIGILGQSVLWELGAVQTYMHPFKPADVAQALSANGGGENSKAAVRESTQKMKQYGRSSQHESFGVTGIISKETESTGSTPILPPIVSGSQPNMLTGMTREPSTRLDLMDKPTGKLQRKAAVGSNYMADRSVSPGETMSTATGTRLQRVHTSDLLKRDQGSSWYSRSLYAREMFHNPQQKRKRSLAKPPALTSGAGLRVYHRLQPFELEDITVPLADAMQLSRQPQVGLGAPASTSQTSK